MSGQKNRQKDRQTSREDTNQSMLGSGQRLQDLIHDAIRQKRCHAQLHFTDKTRRRHNTDQKITFSFQNLQLTKMMCYKTVQIMGYLPVSCLQVLF